MANMYRVGGNGNGSVTLSGDAATSDVLSGKTFYSNSTQMQTGAMTNNGAVTQALDCGDSYTVPEGYHNGSGTVSANSLASQTGVDSGMSSIEADKMVSGYQGWVDGQKVTGTFEPDTVNNTAMSTQMGDRIIYPDSGKYFDRFIVEQFPREYVIPTHIYPSDASPVSIAVGDAVTPDIAGYVYASNAAVVPSGNKSLGTYTTNGSKSASCAGYATVSWTNNVSSSPTEETLWTNSSPTSAFATQTITLNSGKKFSDYQYIVFRYNATASSSVGGVVIVPSTLFATDMDGASGSKCAVALGNGSTSGYAVRYCKYISDTQTTVTKCMRTDGTSLSNTTIVPTAIDGINLK